METKEEKNIKHLKKLFVKRFLKKKRILQNSKYGQLVIQANEIQLWLTLLFTLRATTHTKKFFEYLQQLQFGSIINGFKICSNSDEKSLANDLKSYSKNRNKLAHKMYTEKRLTETECESSIKLGEKLLNDLRSKLNNKITL